MATHPSSLTQPRRNVQAFINGILRETLSYYAGNSYLRVLPGEAEIILIGEYLSNNTGKQVSRNSYSDDLTQVVGNEFITDQFDNAEKDAFLGTYLAETVTGSIFDGTRQVAYDSSTIYAPAGSNVPRFVKVVDAGIVNSDFYFRGINESPASAYRNAPQEITFVTSSVQFQVGGLSEPSGSFFRGSAALKRKPAIGVSAYLRMNHHGYFFDILEGVENTRHFEIAKTGGAKFLNSPVVARFVSGGSPVLSQSTSCQNISRTGVNNTPFVDGQAVSRS